MRKEAMEKLLTQLTERTAKAFGDRQVAVILYGSAAAGDYDGEFSDLNILCVLREVTTRELSDAEPVFHWWREQRNPSPLLLSAEEVRGSTDCFPIEFHDMKERRRVLAGEDAIADLEIDDSFYRAQVEHELRAKLLRLRQKAAGAMFDDVVLSRLLAESISTFAVLFRHALRLCGQQGAWTRADIIAQAKEHFGIAGTALETVLRLRDASAARPSASELRTVLDAYIAGISQVIAAVDRLEK